MRTPYALLTAMVLAGCGGQSGPAVQLSGPAPAPATQTFACVSQQLQAMGYQVGSSDVQTGMISGIRVNEPTWPQRLLGMRPTADRLSATITGGELRVSALSADADAEPGETAAVTGATNAGRRDAQRLLNACSVRT